MFRPEPTPLAAYYQPSSPFYSNQQHQHSQHHQSSSPHAPQGNGPLPLDPSTFDFGYRDAAAVGGGGGSFGPGIGIGPRLGPRLGLVGPGLGSVSARGVGGAEEVEEEEAGGEAAGSTRASSHAVASTAALTYRTSGQAQAPTHHHHHLTQSTRPAHPTNPTVAESEAHEFHSSIPRNAALQSQAAYSAYSAPSPSTASTQSCGDSGVAYSPNTAHSASPTPSCSVVSQAPTYHSPTTSSHRQSQPLPVRYRQRAQQGRSHSPLVIKMDGTDEQDQHSMAAQQAAAQNYQPDYKVPMVGDLTPSSAITQEYAKADQIYVEKTINLPQQFSHYRPIRGDGNCGWRAIGFSYFEKLVETGNRVIVDNEIARLNQFNNTCLGPHGGFNYWEDFAEEFINLLGEVAQAMAADLRGASLLVHQRWNDQILNNHFIYYMRLLASTHLKMNAANYEAFVMDSGGVAGYCATAIEGVDREIEHLGIAALVEVLLKPVNMALEVAYLDLSPGTAPNSYRFPEEANGQEDSAFAGVIYTLFRPTHYDILYRTPPPLISPQQYSLQVHRVAFNDSAAMANTQGGMHVLDADQFDTLAMLPGFGAAPAMSMSSSMGGMGSSISDSLSTGNHSPWTNPFPDPAYAAPSPQTLAEQPPPVMAAAPSPEPSIMPQVKVEQAALPRLGGTFSRATSRSSAPGCSIRFSQVQLRYDGDMDVPDATFQVTTSAFKNSVWNRAHFGNPDFQPEEYSPHDEYHDGRLASRKRSG